MKDYNYYIYITTNRAKRPLYTGVTNTVLGRTWQHKQRKIEGFAKKYHCDRLVYYEHYTNINDAIMREKQIKKWRREKKISLIENMNPEWRDLYEGMEL